MENILLRARLRRSTSAATESTTNYSSSCSAFFSPLFPSERTAVNTAADNGVGEDKESVEKVARIFLSNFVLV